MLTLTKKETGRTYLWLWLKNSAWRYVDLWRRREEMRLLDFMLIPKGAVVRIEHSTTDLSDHEALVGEIVLPRIDRPRNLRVINRKVADKVTALALANADCASEFLFNVDVCRRRNKSKLDVVLNRRQVDRKLFLALAREREEEIRVG